MHSEAGKQWHSMALQSHFVYNKCCSSDWLGSLSQCNATSINSSGDMCVMQVVSPFVPTGLIL